MTVVSPFFTFPAISWWTQVSPADTLILDAAENFRKMTNRNRYRISGANNSILLSIPLEKGRDQHAATGDIRIDNQENWQVRHWRALVSAYRRSPYFDHYEPGLKALFDTEYTLLKDFSLASIEWGKRQLRMAFDISRADTFVNEYPPDIADLRKELAPVVSLPKYHQVFEDRIGFIPDLSILDLLFSEGPNAVRLLLP